MTALEQIAQLLGLLSLIQGVEFLSIRRSWTAQGVWPWKVLSKELTPTLGFLLNDRGFYCINVARIFMALTVILIPNVWCVFLLFLIHILTVIRWLGSFNGGSDYMTSILFLFTTVGFIFPDDMGAVCLWYITFQLCLSYCKAGWIKIKNPKWRNGEALSEFVLSPIYASHSTLSRIFQQRQLSLMAAWSVMIFEISFPLALLDIRLTIGYLGIGFMFHLGNAYVFGLNRFVFAWAAAYPAFFWAAKNI